MEPPQEQAPPQPVAPNFRSENDLTRVLGRDDPLRMKLTVAEHQLALKIKERIKNDPEIDCVSDYTCAQLAITGKLATEEAVIRDASRRCFGLQEFKKEYKVLDTFEEGCQCLQELFRMFPEVYLSFSFNPNDGTYLYVQDITKLKPSEAFTCHTKVDKWMKGMYYFHHIFHPDMETMRKGII
jgi:hypothetical protein